jgi:kynurenine formamidase
MVANTRTYLDSPFHRFAGATDVAGLPLRSVADLDGMLVRIGAGQRAIDRDALAAYDVGGRAVLDQLPPAGFRFHAAPAPVAGIGSFPVRAYAVIADG